MVKLFIIKITTFQKIELSIEELNAVHSQLAALLLSSVDIHGMFSDM
jgi:hypothetical protein